MVQKLRKSVLTNNKNRCPVRNPNPYFDGKWCCSSRKERQKPVDNQWAQNWGIKSGDGSCDGSELSLQSKCCEGSSIRCKSPPCLPSETRNRKKRSNEQLEIHPHAKIILNEEIEVPNSTSTTLSEIRRHRRALPVLAQFGIVVALAISAYFIGESVIESSNDSIQTEIINQETALKSLTNAVEFDHESLKSVVNQMRVNQDLVLAPNVSSIPTFYAYMKSKTTHEDFDPNKNVRKFQRFYANHISELSIDEAKAFEQNVLQLQNNRLPLNKNFIIALRAKCLSLQKITSKLAQTFCNDLAFHATRWDSGLKFDGVGFELNNKHLKSTIYSIEVKIPILYDGGLTEYDVINLGRFQDENRIRKIPLPPKAVLTSAGTIRPLDEKQCIQMQSYKVCPKHSIKPFSSCLQSVFNGELSKDCTAKDSFSPSTCTSEIFNSAIAISMFGNGTMHYDLGKGDLLLKPDSVFSFSVLPRRLTTGTLFCKQSIHRHVTPDLILPSIDQSLITTIQLVEIQSFHKDLSDIQPTNTQIETLNNGLQDAEKSLKAVKSILKKSTNETTSIFSHFKSHLENTVNTVEKTAKNAAKGLIFKIVLPIVIPAFLILILAITFNAQIQSMCLRRTNSKSTVKPSVSYSHGANNRTESSLDTISS